MQKLGKKNNDGSHMCPVFLVNMLDMSRSNLDMLEQAFDESQPIIRLLDPSWNEDVSSQNFIFFLLFEDTEANVSKESLRNKLSKKWTGRFFQRIRGIIGVKSEEENI